MIIVLQVAGILATLIGLVTIGVGIPVKEFSFGNTLILAGTVGVCTGLILLGLSVVARELRLLTRRLAARLAAEPRLRTALPAFSGAQAAGDPDNAFSREQPMPPTMPPQGEPSMAPPWRDDAASRAGPDAPLEVEPAGGGPAQPPRRRNLMFSSTVRKDRDWSPARPGDPAAAAEPGGAPPASLGDAWPKPDRARSAEVPSQRRASWPAPGEPADGGTPERPAAPVPPPVPGEPAPAVTVLKSGVVDGMSYSLYSDGSIEAQMPEGIMRFGSIDELRAHLDQRS